MNNFIEDNFLFSSVVNCDCNTAINIPCPDQVIGQLDNGKFFVTQRSDIDYIINRNKKCINNILTKPIVVILESPHKSEFNNSGQAIGPALGRTGVLFNNNFSTLIKSSSIFPKINNLKHDIVFMNAVQYQCSLGHYLNTYNNKKLRDTNWKLCFHNKCAKDLDYRLEAISPYAIINLVTKGLCNLQSYVDESIKYRTFYSGIYTTGTHPSTWNFRYAKIL
jgi:hypothetical protein